jgi:hypothetical protein
MPDPARPLELGGIWPSRDRRWHAVWLVGGEDASEMARRSRGPGEHDREDESAENGDHEKAHRDSHRPAADVPCHGG